MDRYLSQRLYKNIGKKGQKRLSKAVVAVIGIGALGTACSELLARAGIGNLLLVDRDIVELSNLQRQFLFNELDIGKPKALAAKETLEKTNSETKVIAMCEDIDPKKISILGKPDFVIAATDNMESRFLLNDYCLKYKIPLIYGGAVSDKGSVYVVNENKPCLRCIFPGVSEETCDTSGVLNACSSIIGSMIAKEAIRLIVKKESEEDLIYFNAWENELSKIKVKKNLKCQACMGNYEYLEGKIETKTISLCGQSAFHIKGMKKDLFFIAEKLSRIGKVTRQEGVLQFKDIILFDDGRAIIKAKSEKEARNIYSKYIGN